MIFPEELKIEAAEAYRQNVLVPGIEHVNRNDWIDAWCCGVTYQMKKKQEEGWHDLRKNPEDLPKDNRDVLVYSGEQWRMCVGIYSPKHKSWEAGCDTIAWMEIPEPPKERSK